MSLYREARRSRARTALVVVVVALLAGLGGYLLGRETAPEPTLSELIPDAREQARPALSSLELVEIEYAQGVDASGDVAAPTELEAAGDHAAAAAAALDAAGDLSAVDPAGIDAAAGAIAELQAAIRAEATQAEVRSLVADARAAVEDLLGGPSGAG